MIYSMLLFFEEFLYEFGLNSSLKVKSNDWRRKKCVVYTRLTYVIVGVSWKFCHTFVDRSFGIRKLLTNLCQSQSHVPSSVFTQFTRSLRLKTRTPPPPPPLLSLSHSHSLSRMMVMRAQRIRRDFYRADIIWNVDWTCVTHFISPSILFHS